MSYIPSCKNGLWLKNFNKQHSHVKSHHSGAAFNHPSLTTSWCQHYIQLFLWLMDIILLFTRATFSSSPENTNSQLTVES